MIIADIISCSHIDVIPITDTISQKLINFNDRNFTPKNKVTLKKKKKKNIMFNTVFTAVCSTIQQCYEQMEYAKCFVEAIHTKSESKKLTS